MKNFRYRNLLYKNIYIFIYLFVYNKKNIIYKIFCYIGVR